MPNDNFGLDEEFTGLGSFPSEAEKLKQEEMSYLRGDDEALNRLVDAVLRKNPSWDDWA